MVEADEFLEHAQVFDNCYGTARASVEALLASGKHVILEIEVQGGIQVAVPGELVFEGFKAFKVLHVQRGQGLGFLGFVGFVVSIFCGIVVTLFSRSVSVIGLRSV